MLTGFLHFIFLAYSICLTLVIATYHDSGMFAKENKSHKHRLVCFGLFIFHFMIYDHETQISYKSASVVTFIEWLNKSSLTSHREAVQKDGAEILWGWSLPDSIRSWEDLSPFLLKLIQWRWQHHLTWSTRKQ